MSLLWAPQAWVDGRWQAAVCLRIGADGRWAEVTPGMPAPDAALRLAGPALPGVVDAHSHAFQRAFAGLGERRQGAHDDFWSWRDRMYGVALRITPAQLRAVAAQLYAELLAGGYTQVCEFHYLHHDVDGRPCADPLAMSRALAEAAAEVGIGLTLLPALYQRAGFGQPGLRPDQRRFAADVDSVLALRDGVRALGLPGISAGVAVHSLRAATPDALQALARRCADDPGPIHLHIAEQQAEVDDAVAALGARPIQWLAANLPLDARWQLVHATHALPTEVDAVAASGAGVVLCPGTEADLGDGLPDLPRWLTGATPISVGSDSQVSRAWPAELRWLEHGQRLVQQRRCVAAEAPAETLFQRTLAGGAAAAGFSAWGLQAGARADLLVLDTQAPGLQGVPAALTLDALVFATDAPAFRDAWVAGRQVLADGHHPLAARLAHDFQLTMETLWS